MSAEPQADLRNPLASAPELEALAQIQSSSDVSAPSFDGQALETQRLKPPTMTVPLTGDTSLRLTSLESGKPNSSGDDITDAAVRNKATPRSRNARKEFTSDHGTDGDDVDAKDGYCSSGSEVDDCEVDFHSRYRGPGKGKQLRELGPKRMKQSREYTWLMELRMREMEETIKELKFKVTGERSEEEEEKEKQLTKEKADKEAETMRSIPKLNYVKWEDFKRPRGPDNVPYAIDVLVGDPVIPFRNPNKRGQKVETLPTMTRNEEPPDSSRIPKGLEQPPAGIHNQLPERIRINSKALLHIFENIYRELMGIRPGTCLFFRPYRSLIYFEDDLREWLRKLERKWGTQTSPTSMTKEGDMEFTDPGDHGDQSLQSGEIEDPRSKEITVAQWPWGSEDEYFPPYTGTREAMDNLRCLLGFVDNVIKVRVDTLKGDTCQKVYFSDMWHLFGPGDQVISSTGRRQAYRVVQVTGVKHHTHYVNMKNIWKAPPVVLHCKYLDCNGRILGPVSTKIEIHPFDGERDIRSLPVYPIRFAKKLDTTPENLLARGRLFMELCKVKHVQFTGITLDTQEEVDSQVIVDFEQTLQHNPTWEPTIENLPSGISEERDPAEDNTLPCFIKGCCNDEPFHADFYVDIKRMKEYTQQNPEMSLYSRALSSILDGSDLRENELLLLHHRVFAFILRSRKWAKIGISDIREVIRRDDKDGFDQLVLPKGHKDMVRSLVKQHFRERISKSKEEEEVDLVRGKGKGLIILLHGAPGVGKTSTAECVADSFNKPLFPITCGDLGITAMDVEKRLETNFTLAHRWGCVLLLDEADIFLAERTKEDFLRNSLVSVFLRVLEYYAGVLFLTTNRVGSFDEAFKSRIHISLYYPPLDEDSTQQVWRMNLIRTKKRKQKNPNFKMESKKILEYALEHFHTDPEARWNGRQIRNAFQTAIALAEFEASAEDDKPDPNARIILKQAHFKTVAKASLHFDGYLKDLYGATASKRAYYSQARYDDYGYSLGADQMQWSQNHDGVYHQGPPRYHDRSHIAAQPLRRQPVYEDNQAFRAQPRVPTSKATGKKAGRKYPTPPNDNESDLGLEDPELEDLELDDPELGDPELDDFSEGEDWEIDSKMRKPAPKLAGGKPRTDGRR